jgi:hypothetical protein
MRNHAHKASKGTKRNCAVLLLCAWWPTTNRKGFLLQVKKADLVHELAKLQGTKLTRAQLGKKQRPTLLKDAIKNKRIAIEDTDWRTKLLATSNVELRQRKVLLLMTLLILF